MVFRRYNRRKLTMRRKRYTRRTVFKRSRGTVSTMRVLKSMNSNMVHSFTTSYTKPVLDYTTNFDSYLAYDFKLNEIPNYSRYIALYDQYRINYLVVRIIQRGTSLSGPEVADRKTGWPRMYYVIDRDDTNAPASVNELRENSRSRMFVFTPERRVCKIAFKPSTLAPVYQSALGTSYEINYNKWIDQHDDGSTPYFGIKIAIPLIDVTATTALVRFNFDVEVKVYFQCRQPK